MTDNQKYPYQLESIFVVSVSFRRLNVLPTPLEIPTNIGIQYIETVFPRIQLGMKVKSEDDSAVPFNLEVIGLFSYIGEGKEYETELNQEFATEKGFHMLWVYCSQIVTMISSQMGMSPLQMRAPTSFEDLKLQLSTNKRANVAKRNKKPA